MREPDARGRALEATGPAVELAAERFEEELSIAIRVASLEARARRLAREIRRTSSRVNALRTRVVPDLEAETRAIEFALEQLAASGHSRAPVAHDRNLDDVVGVVHLRDLLDQGDRPVSELTGELVAFPETAGVLDVLHEMQTRRVQLALVVDEHGAAAGIVTVEDLLEELVGEIYDESARRLAGHAWPLPGARPGRRGC